MERITMRTENELTMRNLRNLNQELQVQIKEVRWGNVLIRGPHERQEYENTTLQHRSCAHMLNLILLWCSLLFLINPRTFYRRHEGQKKSKERIECFSIIKSVEPILRCY